MCDGDDAGTAAAAGDGIGIGPTSSVGTGGAGGQGGAGGSSSTGDPGPGPADPGESLATNAESNPTAFAIARAFSTLFGLMPGNPFGLVAQHAINTEGNLTPAQSLANAQAAPAAEGSASVGFDPLTLSGPPEMTTRSIEGAFAPGGAVSGAGGAPTPTGPTQAQKANAAARMGGGISPDFLSNLAMLESLR